MDNFNNNFQPGNSQPEEPQNNMPPGHPNYPKVSPITAALIGLFGGFFLYQVVGGLLTILVFGLDLQHAPVTSVRLMTVAGQILFILLPALIFAKIFYEDVGYIIRFRIPKIEEIFLFLIGIAILTPLIQYYLIIQSYLVDLWSTNSSFIHLLKSYLDKVNDMVDKTYGNLLSPRSIIDGLFVVIVVSVVPAICEEIMFRGFIQKSFEFKLKPFNAALITAIFFGIYHFNPYALVPLILIGLYFGFAAYMSNSIFVPISLHFINNFIAVLFYFIFGNDDTMIPPVSKNFSLTTACIILSILIILFVGIVYVIKRYYSVKIKA
jgi:membrane protease YdiL (CAAX protease family)